MELKCKNCNSHKLKREGDYYVCEYCGSQYAIEKKDDDNKKTDTTATANQAGSNSPLGNDIPAKQILNKVSRFAFGRMRRLIIIGAIWFVFIVVSMFVAIINDAIHEDSNTSVIENNSTTNECPIEIDRDFSVIDNGSSYVISGWVKANTSSSGTAIIYIYYTQGTTTKKYYQAVTLNSSSIQLVYSDSIYGVKPVIKKITCHVNQKVYTLSGS